MMGFRPNRGCHRAIRKLNTMLERKPTSYVLDADVKGFFQHLDHEWIIRFIESKIKDPNITRLVRRMLKAGIMNDYQFEATEEGSGQGSVCSPVISCIYMHYVLVWWFKEVITPAFRYNVMKSLFYWLNRRSQKKSYNWVEFLNMIDNSYPLVRAKIYVSVYD